MLKRFNRSSFNSEMVERSTSMSKDKEFGVTVLAGTEKVFQKMLCHSRVMGNNLRDSVCLTGTGKIRAVLGRVIVSNQSGICTTNDFSIILF